MITVTEVTFVVQYVILIRVWNTLQIFHSPLAIVQFRRIFNTPIRQKSLVPLYPCSFKILPPMYQTLNMAATLQMVLLIDCLKLKKSIYKRLCSEDMRKKALQYQAITNKKWRHQSEERRVTSRVHWLLCWSNLEREILCAVLRSLGSPQRGSQCQILINHLL